LARYFRHSVVVGLVAVVVVVATIIAVVVVMATFTYHAVRMIGRYVNATIRTTTQSVPRDAVAVCGY